MIRNIDSKSKCKSTEIGKFYLLSYNVKTLSTEAKLLTLEEELKGVEWDVLGLAEVRRRGENCIHLKSGNIFYHVGNTESKWVWGTGFLINKKWKNNIKMFKSNTDRIVQVLLSQGSSNIRIIQVYAPTSDSTIEDLESFYTKLQEMIDERYDNTRTYIMGDWNSKVGFRKKGEREMGDYGYGQRNSRGERFLEFVSENEMYVMNSFFPNGEKWT